MQGSYRLEFAGALSTLANGLCIAAVCREGMDSGILQLSDKNAAGAANGDQISYPTEQDSVSPGFVAKPEQFAERRPR